MQKVYLGKQVKKTEIPDLQTIDNAISLGLAIKYKRTSLNMSLKRTSLLCGVSDKSLRQLEKGENVTTETLFKIINTLGLKIGLD